MMRHKFVSFLGILALLSGCATHRGSVVMKVDEGEAHVCMGVGEVREGDRVAIYRNDCARTQKLAARTGKYELCRRVKVGEGRVVETLNEHYSVLKVDPGVQFQEGMTVEKL
jgi:hypothetical protein